MTQERNLDEGMSPLTPASSEGTARETGHVDHGTRVADESYFASRSLKSGSAGWFLLMAAFAACFVGGFLFLQSAFRRTDAGTANALAASLAALFPLGAAEHAGRKEGTGGEDHRTGGQPATVGKFDA